MLKLVLNFQMSIKRPAASLVTSPMANEWLYIIKMDRMIFDQLQRLLENGGKLIKKQPKLQNLATLRKIRKTTLLVLRYPNAIAMNGYRYLKLLKKSFSTIYNHSQLLGMSEDQERDMRLDFEHLVLSSENPKTP